MPLYDFEREDGRIVERVFPMAKCPRTIKCSDGVLARKIISGSNVLARGWATGVESSALGVHPNQVRRERAFDQKHGLGDVEYSKRGNPTFRSRGQRRNYLRSRGFHDKDGGYGDG